MLGSTRIQKAPHRKGSRRVNSRLQPKKRPRQRRSQATYESILEAAARLLARHGYAALTTNRVAEKAGVAIGSLYEYFDAKEAIVAEVVRRTAREIADDIAGSFEHALDAGMERSVSGLIHAMFQSVQARSELVRVIWTEVPFLWQLEEISALPGLLLGIARQGIPGARSPWLLRDPEAATYLLTVMVAAAVVESVVARPEDLTLEQLERSLVDLLGSVL